MTIPFPTPRPLLQDLVFDEAVHLVRGRPVSVYDGLYRVGKHCSVTAVAIPLGGEYWRIQLEFRAFEPDLVNWRKLRISLLDNAGARKAVLQPLSTGSAAQTVTRESFSLEVFRGSVIALNREQKFIEQRPELQALSSAAATTDVPRGDSELLARRFRSGELDLDFWILQAGDSIHVVVATAEPLRFDLQGQSLVLLLIRKTTGEVLRTLTMPPLERRDPIPEMDRFPLGEIARKQGWFRHEEYEVALDEGCFIELIKPSRS